MARNILEYLITDLESARRIIAVLKTVNPEIDFVWVDSSTYDRIIFAHPSRSPFVDGVRIMYDSESNRAGGNDLSDDIKQRGGTVWLREQLRLDEVERRLKYNARS